MIKDKTAEQFRILYEQWEQYLKARFGKKNMRMLSQKFWLEEVDKCKKEKISENQLLGLINVRNAYIHSSSLLEIKRYAVVLLRRLINTFCKKAKDIAILKSKIYKVAPETKIKLVINEMKDNLYTHVPIVQKKSFYGVFSENTLLKAIALGKWRDNLKILDVIDLCKNNKGTDDYKFLSEDANFYDVYELFQEYIDHGKRLGVVFLTKNGQEIGVINGLITAWDLHKGLSLSGTNKIN